MIVASHLDNEKIPTYLLLTVAVYIEEFAICHDCGTREHKHITKIVMGRAEEEVWSSNYPINHRGRARD